MLCSGAGSVSQLPSRARREGIAEGCRRAGLVFLVSDAWFSARAVLEPRAQSSRNRCPCSRLPVSRASGPELEVVQGSACFPGSGGASGRGDRSHEASGWQCLGCPRNAGRVPGFRSRGEGLSRPKWAAPLGSDPGRHCFSLLISNSRNVMTCFQYPCLKKERLGSTES